MNNISEIERCELDKLYKEIENSPKKVVVLINRFLKRILSLSKRESYNRV